MLVTLSEILTLAEAGRYAVLAPDFPSLFIARTLLEQAEEFKAPIILSYSTLFKSMLDVRSYAHFIRIVREEAESASVPVTLHLDHAPEMNDIREVVDLGFTSVMIDASFEPYEINLERTIQCLQIARPAGVSVEAELGHVSSGEGYVMEDKFKKVLTNPEQAVNFTNATGVDALAVSFGTVHGPLVDKLNLDYELLMAIDGKVRIPLVMHGSSGLDGEAIRRTILLGIRKINVYSDIIQAVLNRTFQSLQVQRNDPLKVAKAQATGAKEVFGKFLQFSGSIGKANQGSA